MTEQLNEQTLLALLSNESQKVITVTYDTDYYLEVMDDLEVLDDVELEYFKNTKTYQFKADFDVQVKDLVLVEQGTSIKKVLVLGVKELSALEVADLPFKLRHAIAVLDMKSYNDRVKKDTERAKTLAKALRLAKLKKQRDELLASLDVDSLKESLGL